MKRKSENAGPSETNRIKRKRYRDMYQQEHKKRWANKAEAMANILSVGPVVTLPSNIDMESFNGKHELAWAMEQLYANDGRDFNPNTTYRPRILQMFGKEYELLIQGIYYRCRFSEDFVTCNRKVWTPCLYETESETPDTVARQSRAEVFATHSRNNETWRKSEYAWAADAWSDVFRPMRDDPALAIDKHDYMTGIPDMDPILHKPIPGKSSFVKRTPDATFGLATFTDRDHELPQWTSELLWERLEQLILHPKYGLISDPSRFDASLVFPFMVYEAKGWGGDCRLARRQACSAAAYYLDMLDELARKPGPHLLVGYRRPRLASEHAGVPQMSESVYIFQNIWSGHVTNKAAACDLLDLIDHIHLWAMTEYRTFILEHLRPWHKLCQENYLLEWDSKYDMGDDRKKRRIPNSETRDLSAPAWVSEMSEHSRRRFQSLAKFYLDRSIREYQLLKGKTVCIDQFKYSWSCVMDGCTESTLNSDAELLNHLRLSHDMDDRFLASLTWGLKKEHIVEEIRVRQKQGIMTTGRRCPEDWKPLIFHESGNLEDGKADFEFEGVISYDRRRSGYQKVDEFKSED